MRHFSEIIQTQRSFFNTGQTKDMRFRLASLRKLEHWIRAHDAAILQALRQDLNKPPFEAYATEVGVVLDELKHTIKHAPGWGKPKRKATNLKNFPSFGKVYAEPYGVALIMSPWNYPFMLTVTPIIAAVAAGNCAVVKPSVYAPAASALMARMVKEVFAPGHVTVIEGGRKENEALLNERYDTIFFTGSPGVGRVVMQAAAKHLTPVTLELGGKSPCVVDETAHIKLAAKRIAWGKFTNAGQTCVAPDYVLVHAAVKQRFLNALAAEIKKMYPNALRVVNEKHFNRLLGLMSGQNIFTGGGYDASALKIEPTVLDSPAWDSAVMSEEIFGPILPVLTYKSPAEAVKQINARPKPLAMYLFTSGKEAERFFLNSISFGGGCVNDTIVHLSVPRLPFGGVGESGMGRYHGKAGFDTFTHYKSVLHKSNLVDVPLRYPPYTEVGMGILKRLT